MARQRCVARSLRLLLAGWISIAALGACRAPTSPNIVLITIDTLRADHCILCEETVRIPLIFRWSERIPAGSVIQGPVEIVDVMPTILGLAGISPGELLLQGRDLTSAITTGAALDPEHSVFFQRRVYEKRPVSTFPVDGVVFGRPLRVKGAKYGVRQGNWKYLEAPTEETRELYDLSSDPTERTNLQSRRRELAGELAGQLEAWRNEQDGLALGPVQKAPEEELERLRALGYVR